MDTQGFRRTTITLNVLSSYSIDGMELGAVLENCDTGDLLLGSTGFSEVPLTGKEMADACYEAASDPGFFFLNDDGELTEE